MHDTNTPEIEDDNRGAIIVAYLVIFWLGAIFGVVVGALLS